MATDATGTPTTLYSIPKYATATDPPSGKGFNAAMDAIDLLFSSQPSKTLTQNSNTALIFSGSSGGLTIGGDTNLYRASADNLKTDDSFLVGTNLAVFGTLYLGSTLDTTMVRSAAGAITTPGYFFSKVPAVRATLSSNQSIPNATFTTVAWPLETYDTDVMHDTVTNNSRLTAKTAGIYAIVANVEFASNATGNRAVTITKNGATVLAEQVTNASSTNSTRLSVATQYQLAVNDYVEASVTQTSTAALNLINGSELTAFSMARVG